MAIVTPSSSMSFLGAVNRILQLNGLIRGDTDLLVSFSDTNHASTSAIAQIAVQNEITELSSRGDLPYQHKINQTITLSGSGAGTRSYALASDFVQLWGKAPFFFDKTQNFQIFEFPGGEQQLRQEILTYRTDQGAPYWWYFELGTTQQVSFYPVPNISVDGRLLYYDYQGAINVVNSSDTIPLTTTDQQYAFCEMAARRFKFLYEGKVDIDVETDTVYRAARSRLFTHLKWKQAPRRYGKSYRSGNDLITW